MTVVPSAPSIEHHRDPLGIGEPEPRISWKLTGDPAWRSIDAELEITRTGGASRFLVGSDQQLLVSWPDAPLASRETARVRVRVQNAGGEWSPWSPTTTLETGLLDASDWVAVPVGGAWKELPDSDERRPALVRREFEVDEGLVAARLYVSAHGLHEVELDGARIDDHALAPGWTVYPQRLVYTTHDLTTRLTPGVHALGAWLGDGWYRGRLGWRGGFRNLFGFDQSLIAQLELVYADGRRETIATDATWQAARSPIITSGLYDGEHYDARLELRGWSEPGTTGDEWTPVALHKRDPATLVAPVGPPIRCTQEVTPIAVLRTPSGRTVLDLGQNLVGRLRIRANGPAGTRIVIRTAEVMQDGELYTRPLREAKSTDSYTLAGRPDGEEWEPRFTFHGFRYAEIQGWPGDVEAAVAAGDIVARVYHSDFARTGWFESSDDELNRFHENVVWGMRGNFVGVPTDCPQRDERMGWTGDLQVFAPTASFLFDVAGMLDGWLADVMAEQLPDGTVPWYVPVIPAHHMWTPIRPGAAWGDVITFTPWTLFERYADRGLLGRTFEAAKRWVDLQTRLAGPDRLWDDGFQLGDWLDPDAPPQDPADAKTDRYLVATAYFAASARRVAWMARELGRTEDAAHYTALADEVRAAFVAAYVRSDGRMTSDAQTAYAIAIDFDLLPPDLASIAGDRLAQLVAEAGNRISTGFVGTPLVTDALSETGHLDSAYALLLERGCPSWLYAVTMGATTVWERWDSMLPDGTVHPGTMTSFNHYALGAVADWMHRTVAGLAPAAPGYHRIRFAPRPGGGLSWAAAAHETPYGRAAISWKFVDDELELELEVPLGTTAELDLPGEPLRALGPGRHRVLSAAARPSLR